MAKLSTKKVLKIEPEVIEEPIKDGIKVIAIEDIDAIINNKKISIKSGEMIQLSSTELLFLKGKVNLC